MTQSSLQKFEELRYHPAGKIMTQRNLLITAEFAQLHQGIVEILRYSMENGWKLFETCQFKDFNGKNPQRILGSFNLSSLVFFSFNSPRKMRANGTGKRQGPRPRTSSLLCPPPSSS